MSFENIWEYEFWIKNSLPLLHLATAPFSKSYLCGLPHGLASPLSYNPISILIFTLSRKSNVHRDNNHQLTLLSPLAIIYVYVFVSLSISQAWVLHSLSLFLLIHPFLCYPLHLSFTLSTPLKCLLKDHLSTLYSYHKWSFCSVSFLIFMWYVIVLKILDSFVFYSTELSWYSSPALVILLSQLYKHFSFSFYIHCTNISKTRTVFSWSFLTDFPSLSHELNYVYTGSLIFPPLLRPRICLLCFHNK